MIFDQSESNLNAWKTEMHMYEKNKRTKRPFGKTTSQVEHVTHQHIKTKECLFNPILQTYQRSQDEAKAEIRSQQNRTKSLMNHLKQTLKYQKNFDIVNLKSNIAYQSTQPHRKQGPIRNAYNVINNQKLPEFFFQKREIKLPIQREKKLLNNNKKQYDILTNVFNQDHQHRLKEQIDKQNEELSRKYWKTHEYDPVYGKYYDQKREEWFQKERTVRQAEHGKDAEKKLPPSYVYREPFIADYTKPLPETLMILDERNSNAKKRYQMKYIVLDEYSKRNLQEEAKQQQVLKNHVHFGRVLDEKAKQFDIITNKNYKKARAEELYGKKLAIGSWDQLIKQASKAPAKMLIKSGGFA